MDTVTSSDTSEVKEIAFQPSIHVDTKVYVGDEGVQKCGDAEEHVEGIAGKSEVPMYEFLTQETQNQALLLLTA